MERRFSLARAILPIVTVAIVAACASAGSGGSGAYSYGYMIPGATVASAFRIGPNDTIAEFPGVSSIPSVVRNGITQETITGRFDSTCTRRFGNGTIYPVMFFRSCNPARGTEADPVVIVGFGPDGRPVNRVPWNGLSTVAVLSPARRF